MSEQEVIDFYNELVDYYGDSLANFEHHPMMFQHQVKLYRYYKERKNEDSNSDGPRN